MSQWVTDTHGLLWHLYGGKKLSKPARDAFKKADRGEDQIFIPTISLVEIVYLAEKNKIAADAVKEVLNLLETGADNYLIAPLNLQVVTALQQVNASIVPDMPDRIIAATALYLNIPLLSRDHKIQALPNLKVVW